MPDQVQPETWVAPEADPLIGQEVSGAYRITRKIGIGGMGAVYEARHLRLNRRVAVKVLNADLAQDPTYLERFRREAEVTSKLKHKHIAEVLDFNTLPDGSPYMVMEYLDGEDLAARIKRLGMVPPLEMVPVIEGIANALAATHKIGVLHRDIKPANIYLAKIEGVEVAKLLDFGAAKQKGHDSNLTAFGQVLGSIHYVSPEQARGQDLDSRTDLFSLGIVLYEALTGHNPFEAETPNDTLFKIVSDPPTPLKTYNATLSPALEEVLHKAMAKKREDRFATAMEFAEAATWALDPARRKRPQVFVTGSRPAVVVAADGAQALAPPEPFPRPGAQPLVISPKNAAAPPPPQSSPELQARLASLQAVGLLTPETLREGQALERTEGELVFDRLVEAGKLDEKGLLRHWVGTTKLKYLSRETLAKSKVPPDALSKLTAAHSEKLGVLPVAFSAADQTLTVATWDPQPELFEKVRLGARVAKVQGILALVGTIRAGVRRYYHGDVQAFSRPEPKPARPAPLAALLPPPVAAPAPNPQVITSPSLKRRPDDEFDTLPPQKAMAAAEPTRPTTDPSEVESTRVTSLAPPDAIIEELLLSAKLVDAAGLDVARALQRDRGGYLGDALLRLNLVTEVDFLRTFAEAYGVRFVKSDKVTKVAFAPEMLERFPVRLAESLRVMPFSRHPQTGETHVIAAIPLDPQTAAEVQKHTGAPTVTLYLATPGAVAAAIRRWYYGETDVFASVTPNGAGPSMTGGPPARERSQPPVDATPAQLPAAAQEATRVGVVLQSEPEPEPEVEPEPVAPPPARVELERAELGVVLQAMPEQAPETKTVQFTALTLPAEARPPTPPEALALDFQRRLTLEADGVTMIKVALSALREVFPTVGSAVVREDGTQVPTGLRAELKEAVPASLVAAAKAAKGPLLIEDVTTDERVCNTILASSGQVRSAAVVGLRGRDRELGVLMVDSASTLGEAELSLLGVLANLLSMRLEDSERLERLRGRERERIRLGRFVSPNRLSDAFNGLVTGLRPEGVMIESTLLFCKLRGVAALSEQLPATEVMTALNRLWSELAAVVGEFGGCIERIQGEGLVALWSPEISGVDEASQAIKCALRLEQRARGMELAGKPLVMRVGLHSGPVALGLVGPEARKDFSAIGPAVRLAARLCAIALEGQVVCSQATLTRAGSRAGVKPIPLQAVEGFGPSQMAFLIGANEAQELDLGF